MILIRVIKDGKQSKNVFLCKKVIRSKKPMTQDDGTGKPCPKCGTPMVNLSSINQRQCTSSRGDKKQ